MHSSMLFLNFYVFCHQFHGKVFAYRKFFVTLWIVLAEICWLIILSQISCENVGTVFWGRSVGTVKTSNMRATTKIDSERIKITPKGSMQGLKFESNKQIKFLSVEVNETFQNLLGYSATDCSLSTIKKVNFEGLKQLKDLWLNKNEISSISSETFEDLFAFEDL